MPRELLQKSGTNAAAIEGGATEALRYPTRLKVQLTQLELKRYGHFNTLRVVNKSSKRARIHFEPTVTATNYEDIEANSIRNIDFGDGIAFPNFDIECLDTVNDIAIGEIQYKASVMVE